ncbi:competence type IV pilus major pilin ComGC [Pontibacillus sp. HMF3514]|uniref:competence type IV pilus major pilin ComGC n=1 Tax=Pontibacillus sp. HMF3514 TaxID=2692425 RepID=UPI00131FFA0B|nr:prepilin-type N-terminal cleavage/methylation domain-containing protein [Pontibacillus sp. HMF3514]QHE53143.1 prepilin-type N-terminal cleavage/methylation domain-containing protein [Pontibacillus sp. HMF3514]
MVNKLRKIFKNEKGFTLVELLAVIVILGIIAAIAVPSIAGIIDNTKQDAHEANGIAMIEASRLALASGYEGATADEYTLGELVNNGFLESVPSHPDGGSYSESNSKVEITVQASGPDSFEVTLNDGSDIFTDKTVNDLQQ